MKKKQILRVMARLGLFTLIMSLGTIIILMLDETESLALVDLSDASVQVMARAPQGEALYAELADGSLPGGIYRSDDEGRTWYRTDAEASLAFNTLAVHAANEAVLYAGAAGGPLGPTNNVWRSQDGGESWHNFNLSLPASPDYVVPDVTAIVTDPLQPGVLYVGTDGQGVYRFTDGQLGFELVGRLSLYDAHVKALVMGADSRLYALTNGGLFVTTGETWAKIETVPEVPVSLAVAPSAPHIVYAGGPSTGLYRSIDSGQSWEGMSGGLGMLPGVALRISSIGVDRRDADHVVVGTAYGLGSRLTGGGIYESYTGGDPWRKLGDVEGLVRQLILTERGVRAVTTKGVVSYGEWTEPVPQPIIPIFNPPLHLSGTQLLVTVLTIGSSMLVLLGRSEWISGHH